ncbi:MAG: transcriptional repressor [Chitinophagaceae bacterium]|nr:MAG: transcriptional repressor [Chitinophagaceae bacterium]
MNPRVKDILKRNDMSVTQSREKILNLFLTNTGAITHGDIEYKAGEKFDRVTVYRTLQSFVEKGIIHIIPSPDNTVKYALCKNDCFEGHHHDNHIHFVCTGCGKTECLDDFIIPAVKLPQGYAASNVEIVVNGVCKTCRK